MRERLQQLIKALPIKTIDRYIMWQFLISYGICASAVLGMFMVIEGVSRLDHFMKQQDPLPLVVFRYFKALLPVYFTAYFGPVLTLLAAMFTITNLHKGQEVTPLKAAGLSVQRILAPFFLMAGFFAVSMMAVQEFVLPTLREDIQQAQSYGEKRAAIDSIWISDSAGNEIEMDYYHPEQKLGEMVVVTKPNRETLRKVEIRAREMCWVGDGWILRGNCQLRGIDDDGKIMRFPVGEEGKYDYEQTFPEYHLATDLRPEDFEAIGRDVSYLTHAQLSLQVKRHSHLKNIEVKLHRRYAFPMANFILLLLGLPLVLRGHNQSVILGIVAAILVSVAYLASDAVCADLAGNNQVLPPMLGAWLPVLFFGALGLTLFDGME